MIIRNEYSAVYCSLLFLIVDTSTEIILTTIPSLILFANGDGQNYCQ